MTDAKVAVIILHWNNYEDTCNCLYSLRAATYRNLLTVVVDNASSNDWVERLRAEFPECHFIMNPANYGFAKGNNEGICYILEQNADYVMLLNQIGCRSGFLEPLISAAETLPHPGAVSGTIYDYYRDTGPTNRIYYAGAKLSRWRGTGIVARSGQIDNQDKNQLRWSRLLVDAVCSSQVMYCRMLDC